MIVTVYGEVYNCTSAVKGRDYVTLYDGDAVIASFSGISDFSGFTIEGGEWTAPPKTDAERIAELEAVIDALIGGDTV